jgi:hypothetical protein
VFDLADDFLERNGGFAGSAGLVEGAEIFELFGGLEQLLVPIQVYDHGDTLSVFVGHESFLAGPAGHETD